MLPNAHARPGAADWPRSSAPHDGAARNPLDVAKCGGCQRMVIAGEGTLFHGASWHTGCLRCATCNQKLTSEFNREMYEGKPYCKTHWPKASILVNSTYLDAQSAFIRSGHKVVLYTDARNAKAEVLARTLEAIRMLERMGISPEDQLCINVGADQARLAWLKTQAPAPLEYPQVFVGDVRVGTLNDLAVAQMDGSLARLIAAARTSGLTLSVSGSDGSLSEPDVAAASAAHEEGAAPPVAQSGAAALQLGWVDSWLNGTQWLLSLPYWMLWGTAPPAPPASPVLYQPAPPRSADDVEVECIRTNWYWRHQRRKLRFCRDRFYRLDQGAGDVVKDIFEYDDVKELHMVDKQNLTISFRSKRSPEYIRAADASAIVRLIQDHATRPEEIKVVQA